MLSRVATTLCLLVSSVAASAAEAAETAEDKHAEAREIYAQRCASCHGKDLSGGNAQSMLDNVWQFGAGDGDLRKNIKFGISSVGMPDYQQALSNSQISQLVKLIRHAQGEAAIEPPPLPEKLYARDYDVRVEKWIAGGLELPWALTFIDDSTALVTERPGRLRIVRDGKLEPEPISGTPEVFSKGQSGLMDVAVDPKYEENGWVYLCYGHALDQKDEKGNQPAMTRVVRGRIAEGAWKDEQTIWEAPKDHYHTTGVHYGSRIAFDPKGRLYFSIGDRGSQDDAQDPSLSNGKIHRIWPDGSIPEDNPFATGTNEAGVAGMPSVFSYGHRNPQGLAMHPASGRIWESEHGPMGGDEINVLKRGANFGWPKITYGLNYNGTAVTDHQRAKGMLQPVYYWAPSIAVCGIEFCNGKEFPRWKNHLIVGGLGYQTLVRLALSGGRVMHQEQLLKNVGRVRDVACDANGAIYVVLNSPDIVLKLTQISPALRQ